VQGVQPTGEYPSGTLITDQLINLTNTVQTVTYHFKARIRDDRPGHGGFFCDQGGDTLIIIYVEPTARVTGTISNDTICNINPITYTLSTPNTPLYGIRFNVNVVNPYPEISGYITPRTNLTVSSVITETLTNTGDTARMIMYIITPALIDILGAQKCPGVNDTLRLWINPTPRATPINGKPEMCYGGLTMITLNTPTVMTKGDLRFNYTITVSDPGIVGNTIPLNDQAPGQQLIFSYQNNSDTINSVYYYITPTNVLSGCPNGNVYTDSVMVHPHPLQNMYPPTMYTCSGSTMGVLTAILSRGSKPNTLFWDRPSFIGDTTIYNSFNNIDSLVVRYTGQYSVTVFDSFNCQRTSQTEDVTGAVFQTILTAVPYPTGYGTQCPGDSNGHIQIIEDFGSTGVAPFEYWLVLNGSDTVSHGTIGAKGITTDIFDLSAGSYNLLIQDSNGCFNDFSNTHVDLTEPETISVSFTTTKYAGNFDVSCRGYDDGHVWVSSISGGNPGGYRYQWYTFDGTITGIDTLDRLDNITAGTYYLLTTDRYCTKLDNVTLIQGPGMDLTSYNLHYTSDSAYNISCNGGNDGSIDLTIDGGSKPYVYLWTDSASYTSTLEDISGLRAGTYIVEVKDQNGCILKLLPGALLPSFTLNEPDPIDIAPVLSNSPFGSYNINCNGGIGSIDITVSGGSGGTYIYTWSTTTGSGLVPTQEDQGALTVGSYRLDVKDLYGCPAVFDTVLTEPPALAATLKPKHITCEAPGMNNGEVDLTVTGGVSPYTFLWSNLDTTEDISGLTAGTYTVTITDANGCQLIESVVINLPPPLKFTYAMSNHNGNGFNVSCFNGSDGSIKITTTSGVAPFVFSWTGPGVFTSTSNEISGLRAGDYNLHIADSNSCTNDTIFTITEPGELSMTFDPSHSISGDYNINCAGESKGSINVVPVNAVGNVSYLWSDGNTSQLRENIPAGDYKVIITDSNSCWARDSITLTQPDSLKLVFDIKQPWCTDKPDGEIRLTASGGVVGPDYTYKWSDNSTSRDITNVLSGWYSVTVSDLNFCSIKDSVNIEPQQEVCLIIPNAISPNGDLINDVWNIGEKELYPQIEIKIFNRWGILVWKSEKGYPQPWDGRSRGSVLPIDSYHYLIDLHNGTKPLIGNITIVK
jgi:gliding motility-associated-like protein